MQVISKKRPTRPEGRLLAIKSSNNTCQRKLVWELGLIFAKMIPKQQNPSRKPRPSVPILPRKPRPPAPQPSRKLRPPVPTPSRKHKPFAPWPSGMQRPRELPRLTHFTNHMVSPSSAWKNKLLRRRVRVNLTSSPLVKPPTSQPCGTP